MARSGGAVTERSQIAAFTTLLRDFVTEVEILAEEETLAWAQRFSERLSSFDRNPNLKVTLSAEQPGGTGDAVVPNGTSHGAGTANGSAAPAVSETTRQHRVRPAADHATVPLIAYGGTKPKQGVVELWLELPAR